jgi:hypothetical protein
MVISRKCKMSKWNKIQNALKNVKNIDDAYIILKQFRLTNEENCTIANNGREKMILARHRVIINSTLLLHKEYIV